MIDLINVVFPIPFMEKTSCESSFISKCNQYKLVENGLLDEEIRAILLNQTHSGINIAHYLKKNTQNDKTRKNRLELYDKYFPY